MNDELKTIFGIVSGVLTLFGFGPYIFSMIKGHTKPKRVTWWIWTLNSLLLLTSYRAEGAQETIWLAAAYVVGCVTIALFSIKYGIGVWSNIDRICLFGSVIAAVLWILIGPLATFFTSLVIDLFGVAPTIYRSFLHPEEEDKLSWSIWFAGGFLSLLLVENIFFPSHWSFETLTIVAYPAQISITTAIITYSLFKQSKKATID